MIVGPDNLSGFSGAQTESIIQQAIEHPERFVLKPQREGGGTLFFVSFLSLSEFNLIFYLSFVREFKT